MNAGDRRLGHVDRGEIAGVGRVSRCVIKSPKRIIPCLLNAAIRQHFPRRRESPAFQRPRPASRGGFRVPGGAASDLVGPQVVPGAGHDLEEVVGAESLVAAAADVEPPVPGHDVQSGALLG